jgi:NodT family efflux transporter outer membrane factor (OMF) lipoprotein
MPDRIFGACPSNHSATANVGVRSNIPGLLIIALSLTLISCTVTVPSDPEVDSPVSVPDAWNSGDDSAVMPWSRDIHDPKLYTLISTALRQNFDLQAVIARVDAARARSRIAGADRLPQVDVTYRGARTKRSASGGVSFVANPVTSQNLSLELAWELDVWGRLRASTRAAIANYQAAEKDLAAARLLLSANIARSWFNAVEADQQTKLAEITQQSFRSSLSIIEQRFQRGIGTALDVRLARGNVATADANLFLTRRERDAAIRILKVLTGSYPDTDLELADNLPRFSNRVPAGLPSTLLLRRPDLHAGRWRVLAASELVKSSQKQLLPRFVLTGSAGTASGSLRDLIDIDGLIWNLVGGITQPIFQGGRIRADIDLSQASERELLALYAQTVLDAFNEVESSLAAEHYLSAQERALDTSVKEQKAALLLAQQQYENGLVGIITLLETQRRAFNAESAWLSTLNQKLQNRINLHLALGGDFYTI